MVPSMPCRNMVGVSKLKTWLNVLATNFTAIVRHHKLCGNQSTAKRLTDHRSRGGHEASLYTHVGICSASSLFSLMAAKRSTQEMGHISKASLPLMGRKNKKNKKKKAVASSSTPCERTSANPELSRDKKDAKQELRRKKRKLARGKQDAKQELGRSKRKLIGDKTGAVREKKNTKQKLAHGKQELAPEKCVKSSHAIDDLFANSNKVAQACIRARMCSGVWRMDCL